MYKVVSKIDSETYEVAVVNTYADAQKAISQLYNANPDGCYSWEFAD